MSVRRGTARLVTAGVLLSGLVGAGVAVAAPAQAADDSVRLRAASSFTAGGSPGSVTVAISKRTEGCVGVRSALGIRLPGLTPEQVLVETAVGGRWRPVQVSSGGADLVVTQRTRPERPTLCERKSVSLRYRLRFNDLTPNGTLLLVAEAYTAEGTLLARDSDSARVRGGRPAAAPTLPTVAPTSAAPTPEATPETEEVAAVAPARSSVDTDPAAADEGGGISGLTAVLIALGVGMVGVGVALMVLLIRRGRAERPGAATGPYPAGLGGDAERTAVLPPTGGPGRSFPPAGSRRPDAAPHAGAPLHPGALPHPAAPPHPGAALPPPRQLGAPFQVDPAGGGPSPEATLILPTGVPPRRPARPEPSAATGVDEGPGPEATFILPTERAPKRRPEN